VWIALLAGCDKLFSLLPVPEPAADASMIDGAVGTADVALADVSTTSDAALGDLGCPLDYTITLAANVSTSKYRYVAQSVAWGAAQADCVDDKLSPSTKHTHLAVLSSDQERGDMYFTAAGSKGAVWVGLSDRIIETQFRWVTNEDTGGYPPTNAWLDGRPGGDGNCVIVMSSTTVLDDIGCLAAAGNELPVGFVCECDANADQPSNY
jgi:hypothetical protein